MIECRMDKNGHGCTVVADGPLTIERAADLRAALLGSLRADGEIAVDFSGVADTDLACLQLLCSMCKSVLKLGRRVSVVKLSGDFTARAKSGGFVGLRCAESGRCLVAGGGHE